MCNDVTFAFNTGKSSRMSVIDASSIISLFIVVNVTFIARSTDKTGISTLISNIFLFRCCTFADVFVMITSPVAAMCEIYVVLPDPGSPSYIVAFLIRLLTLLESMFYLNKPEIFRMIEPIEMLNDVTVIVRVPSGTSTLHCTNWLCTITVLQSHDC